MGNTKTKTYKLKGRDWLEIFVEKDGQKYAIQFTERSLSLIKDWDGENMKTLFHAKLSKIPHNGVETYPILGIDKLTK